VVRWSWFVLAGAGALPCGSVEPAYVERDGYAQKRARAEEKHIGRPSKFAPYRLQLEARLAEECSKAKMKRRTKRVFSCYPDDPALSFNERFPPGTIFL
jgi:hypothetical protein